jgi:ABC-type nickel/cobalt efflux system permease component RcnA
MLSILLLGLLLGLQHAVEADHLAAVASLTTRSKSLRDAARHGSAWGLGHALTLLLFGGLVLLIDGIIGERLALWLETAVALMLIVLGLDVLWRLWRRRVHFHVHSHGEQRHFHAHSHSARTDHARDPHRHTHPQQLPLRSLLVGMMHGMAGSAALIVLALGSAHSPWQGLAYIAVFGFGSIIGMTLLALVISLPLRWSSRSLTWAHNGMTLVLGLVTVTIGGLLLQQTAASLLTGGISG